MSSLTDALYLYAIKYRTDAYLQQEKKELSDSQRMVDYALEQLKTMGEATADYAQRIESGLTTLSSINEEASFLAGLSIGLELSRL